MNPFWKTPIKGGSAILRSYKPKLALSKSKDTFAFVADLIVVRKRASLGSHQLAAEGHESPAHAASCCREYVGCSSSSVYSASIVALRHSWRFHSGAVMFYASDENIA